MSGIRYTYAYRDVTQSGSLYDSSCGLYAYITIDLESKEACFAFINRLKLIRRATNLFDNKTLAIHPASTIFGPFTDKQRQDMDVLDTTIRFSIGLEDVDDLFDDVRQALNNKKD